MSKSSVNPKPVATGRYRYTKWRWRISVAILDAVGAVFMIFWRTFRPARRVDSPRKILVVQLDHMGDAILSTPIFPGFARLIPKRLSRYSPRQATARSSKPTLKWIASILRIEIGLNVSQDVDHLAPRSGRSAYRFGRAALIWASTSEATSSPSSCSLLPAFPVGWAGRWVEAGSC